MFSGLDKCPLNHLGQAVWPHWPPILQMGPVSSLPARTLQEIFLYACDTYILEDQMPDLWIGRAKCVMMAPVTLSQVCKRWRNIANTTPRLWRNAVVRLAFGTSTYATEMLEEFILKSDPYTINLCFLGIPEPPQLAMRSACDTTSQIAEYSPQLSPEDDGYAAMEQRVQLWPAPALRGFSKEIIDIVIKSSRRWERVLFSGTVSTY